MKSLIFLLTSLFLFSAHAQIDPDMSGGTVTPAPMPPTSGSGRVYNFQGDCHFRPEISQEDNSLLNNAKSAVEALRNNSACAALAPQFDTFATAMTNYNRYTGADRVPGFDGNVNVNCVNFDQVYDMSYDFFVNNYATDNNNLPADFVSCQNQDRTAAINCAAMLTGRLKAKKRFDCEQSGESINEAERAKVVADSYRTGLAALNAIINNNDCIDATGSQKMSFVQSAVGLAGRAAIIGTGGVGAPLIGLATNLVGSLISKIFNNSSKDNLAQLQNRGNMAELACLYEKLEDKANRCDRATASIQVEHSQSSFNTATSCLAASHKETSEVDRFLTQTSEIIGSLNRTPAEGQSPVEFSQQMFENLVDNLNANFPGGNESILAIGEKASEETISQIESALSNDENFKNYLRSQDPDADVSNRALRRSRSELEGKLAKAQKINGILKSIRSADSGSSIDASALQNVRTSLSGSVNFMAEFNEVLRMRANGSDSLSEQITLYNSQLSEARSYMSVINTYNSSRNKQNSRFDDNGTFELARNSLRPHLAKMLENELDTLQSQARDRLSTIAPGPASSQALKDQRLTQEESFVYPILRACNQLQSVMNQGDRSGIRPTRINDQHEVCRAVTCSGGNSRGVQSFTDYLQQNNLNIPDSRDCSSQECTANYTRYICQQKKQLPTIRNRLSSEFINEGKLCGKSLRDALAGR